MPYVIQDLYKLPCQEEKLILFNLRQILTTKAHWKTGDAPVAVQPKLFSQPKHLAAR